MSIRCLSVASSAYVARSGGALLHRMCECGQHTGGGNCKECDKKQMGLQRQSPGRSGPALAPPIVHEVLRSPGQPLDRSTRQFMEERLGHDFSGVRLHTDHRSGESTAAVNALAYTVGNHVVFGANQYAPRGETGRRLLAHELTHTLQQRGESFSSLAITNSEPHEREAENAAAAISSVAAAPFRYSAASRSLYRQQLDNDRPPAVDRTFELDPRQFLVPMDAPAEREQEKCEEFPGGSTECELDDTGTPTGKVTQRVDETNPCTKPCVAQHEAVHVKQLKTFCPELRDCYRASDAGKRPASDCVKMAMFGAKRECEAYNVSVPCVEKRVNNAPECKTKANKEYGTRKLASEKCFQSKYCAGAAKK